MNGNHPGDMDFSRLGAEMINEWCKQEWLKKKFVLGTFLQFYDTAAVEILAEAGFDFVVVDLEHGTFSAETVKTLVISAQLNGIVPIVRVKENASQLIMAPLDAGAMGVQIPFICNKADVKKAVTAAKYHPLGSRGMNPFVRGTGYVPERFGAYMEWSNENTVMIHQVEGVEGVNHIDEIVAEPGVDIIFLGPYDLSQSLGIPGKVEDPAVISEMETVVSKAGEKGIAVGTFADTPERAKKWIESGVKYLTVSCDTKMMLDGARAISSVLK
jgi:4-hydroxy-2-oxoheptanedioate aldolase